MERKLTLLFSLLVFQFFWGTHVAHAQCAVDAGQDTAVCAGSSVQLNAVGTGGTGSYVYSWSPATGLTDSTIANPVATPSVTTTYTVTMTDTGATGNLGGVIYMRSQVEVPWNRFGIQTAMDTVFGTGNWTEVLYETATPANVFSNANSIIYMEGSNSSATELIAFLSANQALIESWVNGGGVLWVNSAPNEGNGANIGFGGVNLNYPTNNSPTGTAYNPAHPIYNAPNTPVGTAFNGNSWSHGSVSGGGMDTIMTNNNGLVILGEKAYGSGWLLAGSLTAQWIGVAQAAWNPSPQVENLLHNIFEYMEDKASAGGAGDKFYLRSTAAGIPWNRLGVHVAMDTVFGTGNWTEEFYESVSPATVFSPTTCFVFMEGSDDSAIEMLTFLNANQALIESWVSNGGQLIINSAPNEGTGGSLGFGGVSLVYPGGNSATGTGVVPAHPIFNGPYLPVGLSFTGSSWSHGSMSGGGITTLIQSATSQPTLAEKAWGSGNVMFANLTAAFIGNHASWTPNPQVSNVLYNCIAYMASNCSSQCVSTDTITITVNQLPVVSFNGLPANICDNDSMASLTGIPSGGAFSGPGMTGSDFDPAAAGAGMHAVMYDYTDTLGCSASDTQMVTVNAAPMVTFSGLPVSACENDSMVMLMGSPMGGTFTGNGVAGTMFDPAAAGTGMHTVSYSYTDSLGCSDSDAQSVMVNSAPVPTIGLVQNDSAMEASAGVSYQWYLAGSPIAGATSQIYNPGCQAGDYTVVVTDSNGCSGESGIYNFSCPVGIDMMEGPVHLTVFPNPNQGDFFVEFGHNMRGTVDFRVLDLTGRVIAEQSVDKAEETIRTRFELDGLAQGVYYVQVSAEGVNYTWKFVMN